MHSLLSCVSYDELRELDKLSELKFKVGLYMWFVIPESLVETVSETTQNERRELRKRSELQ